MASLLGCVELYRETFYGEFLMCPAPMTQSSYVHKVYPPSDSSRTIRYYVANQTWRDMSLLSFNTLVETFR